MTLAILQQPSPILYYSTINFGLCPVFGTATGSHRAKNGHNN
jgi:hypothetical protein